MASAKKVPYYLNPSPSYLDLYAQNPVPQISPDPTVDPNQPPVTQEQINSTAGANNVPTPAAPPPQPPPMAAQAPAPQAPIPNQDDASYQKFLDQASNPQLFGMSRDEIDNMKKKLSNYEGQSAGFNFGPMLANADAHSGYDVFNAQTGYAGTVNKSNMAGAYKAPESQGERDKNALEMQKEIAASELGLTKEQLDLFKEQNTAEYNKAYKESQHAQHVADEKAKSLEREDKLTADDRDKAAKSPDGAKIAGILEYQKALNEYEAEVRRSGIEPVGERAKLLDRAYQNFVVKFKNKEGLGALSGADVGIAKGTVEGAGGWENYLKSRLQGYDDKAILGQILASRKSSIQESDAKKNAIRAAYPRAGSVIDNWVTQEAALKSEADNNEAQASGLKLGSPVTDSKGVTYYYNGSGSIKDKKNFSKTPPAAVGSN